MFINLFLKKNLLFFFIPILIFLFFLPQKTNALIPFAGRVVSPPVPCTSPPGIFIVNTPFPPTFWTTSIYSAGKISLFGPPKTPVQSILGGFLIPVPCFAGIIPIGIGPLMLIYGTSKI